MGCSLDTDSLTKEERVLISAESSCYLSQLPSTHLEETVTKYSSSEEITETQLHTVLSHLTQRQPRHQATLFSQLSGVPRGELLAFVILMGKGDCREKGMLLYELGTEVMETEGMTREAAEVLADDLISAASEVALKISSDQAVSEYGKRFIKLKEIAVEQLASKMMRKSIRITLKEFLKNYCDQPRYLCLSGIRRFVIGCGEKQK